MNYTADRAPSLEKHKINALASQAPVGLSMGTIAATVIFLVYWYTSSRIEVSIWFGLYLLVYLARYLKIDRYLKTAPEKRNHNLLYRFHLIGAILSGLLWSIIGIYLLNTYSSSEQLYILLILGALAAGAVATDIVMLSVYFSFVFSATLPITFFLLVSGSSQMVLSGLILSVFIIFITSSAFRLNKLVAESLSYQFDNLQLLDELEQEKSQVIRLYSNLEFDLANRKKTEEQLKIEKEKAEELARSLLSISTLDGLTGIPNRRHFDSTLAKEWNRASRSNTPLSLIMCDIDYFKSYNDHYGHQKGDNCLIQVATVLQEHARRDDDMAARYGGEEFAIILPATDLSNAKEIAEQMRMAIINLAIPHRYSSTENIVTASFGIATIIPEKEQQSKTLLALADRALYKAKQLGRNNVATTTPEIIRSNTDESGGINEAS